MTEDGTFDYTWNGENRLVQVAPGTATTNDLRLTFNYPVIPPGRRETGLRDHPPSPRWLRRTGMGRRVQKVEEEYDGSSWSTNAVTKFVWDGWLLIADPTSPFVASKDWRLDGLDSDALTRTHTWGLDLSGTFTGAGGIRLRSGSYGGQVGGLLMVDDDSGDGFCGYYPVIPPDGRETGLRAHDVSPAGGGMGQILDADDLSTDAHYEYDPYGLEIVATGTYADDNPWRFSTKYLDVLDPNDDDASLLYFGFRYLSRRLGRWGSRDPVYEHPRAVPMPSPASPASRSEPNLYALTRNDPASTYDLLGLLRNPDCDNPCHREKSCCVCMVHCEGSNIRPGCAAAIYWVLRNRQGTRWPEFGQEKNGFCAQAMSEGWQCGPVGKKLTSSGRPIGGMKIYDQCCTGTLPPGAPKPNAAVEVCNTPGEDPTGGAQYIVPKGFTKKVIPFVEYEWNHCSRILVDGCDMDIWRCSPRPTRDPPPGYTPQVQK